ncbi:helix-turn-helix domain-containing protein [Aquisediminimonas profunda]|uniref:helix-turn-helix domain-containing protein n=1 Tax=Aquisediminimonas profunda TaxID=1550733 RepID=UPI001C626225|nr:helix-turn-helix transcriptional regulator [Aquisediminimonas profunda]
MDVRKTFGHNVRRLREKTGMAQEKFGLEHNIDRTYLSGIERGVRNPTIIVVKKIADALEVPVAVLFEDVPD